MRNCFYQDSAPFWNGEKGVLPATPCEDRRINSRNQTFEMVERWIDYGHHVDRSYPAEPLFCPDMTYGITVRNATKRTISMIGKIMHPTYKMKSVIKTYYENRGLSTVEARNYATWILAAPKFGNPFQLHTRLDSVNETWLQTAITTLRYYDYLILSEGRDSVCFQRRLLPLMGLVDFGKTHSANEHSSTRSNTNSYSYHCQISDTCGNNCIGGDGDWRKNETAEGYGMLSDLNDYDAKLYTSAKSIWEGDCWLLDLAVEKKWYTPPDRSVEKKRYTPPDRSKSKPKKARKKIR